MRLWKQLVGRLEREDVLHRVAAAKHRLHDGSPALNRRVRADMEDVAHRADRKPLALELGPRHVVRKGTVRARRGVLAAQAVDRFVLLLQAVTSEKRPTWLRKIGG